jgi:hypothetical protein
MADNRPLSENEADDRLKAALNVLGEAPGITVAADTALAAARRALWLISLGLIAAESPTTRQSIGRVSPSAT